ncbi:MAG: DEAD/DEAH box helicase [Bryobacteraceae bacterium]
MIVLHGAARDGQLLIWGESSETLQDVSTQPPRVGRKKLATAWLDAGPEALEKLAENARLLSGAAARNARSAIAWLPSLQGRALPSTALVGEGAATPDAPELMAWRVTVLAVTGETMLQALAACFGKRLLAPGVVIAVDLSYWTSALRFAAGLVMRGQFLPGVKLESETYMARWKAVAAGEDAEKLRVLAEAMPAAARALAWDGAASPAEPPQAALRGFLDAAVDALVRSRDRRISGIPESVHDRWIHALTTSSPAIAGDRAELQTLAAQAEQWQRPIQVSARAPFRLCFRLEEPEGESTDWRIAYLLQAARDPSLLIPASLAWGRDAGSLGKLGNDIAGIREHLLTSLGQAAAICPLVEASLREARPGGCVLDVEAAHQFLRQTAPALEQSGFGVMLPAWWTRHGAQARLTVRAHVKSPKAAGGTGLTLDAIVAFDWQAALGDEEMSRAELVALARLKTPLVKVRGKWVEVNAAEIEAALELMQKKSAGQTRVRDVVRMAFGAGDMAGSLDVDGVSATGWIGDLLGRLENTATLEELPPPEGFLGTLRPYQTRGYSWLRFLKQWGLGACLADDMGLGKTIQALALLQHEYRENPGAPVLLVCPMSVVGNWQKEAARFAPELPVLVHHGATRRRGDAFAGDAMRHAVVISSYALLHRDLDLFQPISWAGLILDEAQNIKNPETKQARAARALDCGYRLALTGTPVENNVQDLWSIMEFLNPGFLGGQAEFRKRFFVPIQVYGDSAAAARLRRVTAPFILRRLKTDKSVIADLPEKQEMKVFCTLTKEQVSLYEAVVKQATEAIESAEGISRKGLVLATLSKLKQVCNHPAQFLQDNSAIPGRSGKLARLGEMLEETLEVGDRSLIFTQFTGMGDLIRRHLQETFGVEVLYLHGGTPKAQRDRMVERFAAPDGPPIFLLSLKAGGTGLNLTSANHVFHFDRWWNPAVEDQATDRAFRIGQTRNVQVHKFLCVGTLEERIDEMIERKKDIAGRVVGAGEAWLTELSNAELKNLFALRKEALGE